MKRRIAHSLRSMADRLDPPPPPITINIPKPPQFVMPVISPEVAAEIGRRMREMTKAMPKFNFPVLPSPPPAPPAPRRLK